MRTRRDDSLSSSVTRDSKRWSWQPALMFRGKKFRIAGQPRCEKGFAQVVQEKTDSFPLSIRALRFRHIWRAAAMPLERTGRTEPSGYCAD